MISELPDMFEKSCAWVRRMELPTAGWAVAVHRMVDSCQENCWSGTSLLHRGLGRSVDCSDLVLEIERRRHSRQRVDEAGGTDIDELPQNWLADWTASRLSCTRSPSDPS